MIIQHRCPVIVMLTKLVDDGKMKCGDYFQSEDGNNTRRFGDICIVTKWINTSQRSLIMRCLEVNRVDSKEEPLCVLHIQYPDWPDHGVPGDTLVVSEILKHTYSNVGPIVVHCSAGIGRTGTYCAINNTIQRILVGDVSARDLDKTIAGFRTQRMRMVSTMEQYLFCYDAIIDELEQFISDTNEV